MPQKRFEGLKPGPTKAGGRINETPNKITKQPLTVEKPGRTSRLDG
jgi:hypothetical protein